MSGCAPSVKQLRRTINPLFHDDAASRCLLVAVSHRYCIATLRRWRRFAPGTALSQDGGQNGVRASYSLPRRCGLSGTELVRGSRQDLEHLVHGRSIVDNVILQSQLILHCLHSGVGQQRRF